MVRASQETEIHQSTMDKPNSPHAAVNRGYASNDSTVIWNSKNEGDIRRGDFVYTQQPIREFVLCFDGTGYKFRGDETDSNVLKIYRMLDRNDPRQFHYYQPGFGTYTSSIWQSHQTNESRINKWFWNTKDAAAGTTFDEHVMDAYRFLMRFYNLGDGIYIFGFSRGAYVARMLAEMIDHVGLLEPGDEGKVRYVWSIFSKCAKCCNSADASENEKDEIFGFMKAMRETFCRPVSRIRFLGLFDTVNSIPRFEVNRNKFRFPFTAKTSARVIRHAVAIDEHRAKFRQDLLSDANPNIRSTRRKFDSSDDRCMGESLYRPGPPVRQQNANVTNQRMDTEPANPTALGIPHGVEDSRFDETDDTLQDIEEVWFPGCHADIGGGLTIDKGEDPTLSHVPLVWMVQEAQRAGLRFDPEKMKKFRCFDDSADNSSLPRHLEPSTQNGNGAQETGEGSEFETTLWRAATNGHIHDLLRHGCGVPRTTALSWRIVECLPFRRMGMQKDGTWKPIRWPLPLGERRDVPKNTKVHGSAIHRMKTNPNYRPKNLLRSEKGKNRWPLEDAIDAWEVYQHQGSPVRETYRRKLNELT